MALIKKYKGKGTSSPLAAYTVKREIDVLGQGRARHGRLGRCQTREFESKPLQKRYRRASFGGKVHNQSKKQPSNMKRASRSHRFSWGGSVARVVVLCRNCDRDTSIAM